MLLQITKKLVDTYKSKFLQETITEEELTELYKPTHFKASKKKKVVPTERPSDTYYERKDAILDFVIAIGAEMSEYQLQELNKKLVTVESKYAQNLQSEGFMRDDTLAKYFVAYAAWRFPKNEALIFDSPEIRETLNAAKENTTYKELHDDFMKLMWPAKILLMIHIAEDKAAQLNNRKLDDAINRAKTEKLFEGYESLKNLGHMRDLETLLLEVIKTSDKRLSKRNSKAEEKLLRPVAADESDSIRPSPSPSFSFARFFRGRVTPSGGASSEPVSPGPASSSTSYSTEGASSVDLDREVARATANVELITANVELILEDFEESNTESARASV
jgi:hypothetical protein